MEAVTREEYLKAVGIVRAYHNQIIADLHDNRQLENLPEISDSPEKSNPALKMKLEDTDMSNRLFNSLCSYFRHVQKISGPTLEDAFKLTEKQVRNIRNLGKHSRYELEKLFTEHGLVWPQKQ